MSQQEEGRRTPQARYEDARKLGKDIIDTVLDRKTQSCDPIIEMEAFTPAIMAKVVSKPAGARITTEDMQTAREGSFQLALEVALQLYYDRRREVPRESLGTLNRFYDALQEGRRIMDDTFRTGNTAYLLRLVRQSRYAKKMSPPDRTPLTDDQMCFLTKHMYHTAINTLGVRISSQNLALGRSR